MTPLHFIFVLIVGILAGTINVLAGGGSLLTLPLLIFLGLPAPMANGTNRVAVWVQNVTAAAGFRSKGFDSIGYGLFLAVPAIIGAIFGALVAVDINETVFKVILAGLMLVMLGVILWNPTKRFQASAENLTLKRKIIAGIAFLFVGFYGGFIQAGVGILIIATLTLVNGLDLVRVNSYKVVINSTYTLIALLIFAVHGEVNWIIGLSLAIGMGIGGWIGSSLAVAKGEKFIKVILVVAVIAMAIKLLVDTLA